MPNVFFVLFLLLLYEIAVQTQMETKNSKLTDLQTGSSTFFVNPPLEFTAAPIEVKKIQILFVIHSRRVVRRTVTGGGRRRGRGAPGRRGRWVTVRDRLDEGDDSNGRWTGSAPLLFSSHFWVSVTGAAGGTSLRYPAA